MHSGLAFHYLGHLTYIEGRRRQALYIDRLRRGEICSGIIYCEHDPVITLGKRSSKEDELQLRETFSHDDLQVVRTDRGGQATYHGPGQLVIYPVIDLASVSLGVKAFVDMGLSVIEDYLTGLGINAVSSLCAPGVWCGLEGEEPRKIAAVGLRIARGITDHGFSLNVKCDLSHFRKFSPCGYSGANITSIEREIGADIDIGLEKMAIIIHRLLSEKLFLGRETESNIY